MFRLGQLVPTSFCPVSPWPFKMWHQRRQCVELMATFAGEKGSAVLWVSISIVKTFIFILLEGGHTDFTPMLE